MIKLPKLPRNVAIVDNNGVPNQTFQTWWQAVAKAVETQEAGQDELLAAIAVILGLTENLEEAVAEAQAAADAAQAAVDSLNIPPVGSRTVTANTTVQATDAFILVDATAGPVTVTLRQLITTPSAVSIRKIDSTAANVIIQAGLGDTINGVASITLTTQYETAECLPSPSGWFA